MPTPIFWLQARYRLDAILTVVDAKHVIQHLDEDKPEGVENEVSMGHCRMDALLTKFLNREGKHSAKQTSYLKGGTYFQTDGK